MNNIPDDLSCTNNDTREFLDTNEDPHGNTEDLSDENDNDGADVTSKSLYLTRNLKSYLGEF